MTVVAMSHGELSRYDTLTRVERRQLRLPEREALFRMKVAQAAGPEDSRRTRPPSSAIYRELRQNYFFDEDAYFRRYFPGDVHKLARDRRVPGRTLERNPELATT